MRGLALALLKSACRCSRTFGNYCGYLKTATLLINREVSVFGDPAVSRAKASIAKRCNFAPRVRKFLTLDILGGLVRWCGRQDDSELKTLAVAYAVTYAFLLRLPSETLPLQKGRAEGKHCMYREGAEVVVQLPCRSTNSSALHAAMCSQPQEKQAHG